MRYNELKFEGKTYTKQWEINEILIDNKFNWIVDAEIENARLEIFKLKDGSKTLVWNAGIWYNGDWFFGTFRDGEWKYGTWRNGVWRNGKWKNGIFKSGIIYNGIFFKGKIESGIIKGGRFIDCEISKSVKELTDEESKLPTATTDIQNEVPQAQTVEKNIIEKMENKNIKNFGQFVKESTGDLEPTFVKIKNEFSDIDIKQTPGEIIIETPSDSTIYNIQKQYGGEVINKNGVYTIHIKDKKN